MAQPRDEQMPHVWIGRRAMERFAQAGGRWEAVLYDRSVGDDVEYVPRAEVAEADRLVGSLMGRLAEQAEEIDRLTYLLRSAERG